MKEPEPARGHRQKCEDQEEGELEVLWLPACFIYNRACPNVKVPHNLMVDSWTYFFHHQIVILYLHFIISIIFFFHKLTVEQFLSPFSDTPMNSRNEATKRKQSSGWPLWSPDTESSGRNSSYENSASVSKYFDDVHHQWHHQDKQQPVVFWLWSFSWVYSWRPSWGHMRARARTGKFVQVPFWSSAGRPAHVEGFCFFQPVPRVANQCPHFHAGHLGKLRSSLSSHVYPSFPKPQGVSGAKPSLKLAATLTSGLQRLSHLPPAEKKVPLESLHFTSLCVSVYWRIIKAMFLGLY